MTGGTASASFGKFKKQQDYLYTSPAIHMGTGPRSDPNQNCPTWTPGAGTYDIAKGGLLNEAPKYK